MKAGDAVRLRLTTFLGGRSLPESQIFVLIEIAAQLAEVNEFLALLRNAPIAYDEKEVDGE